MLIGFLLSPEASATSNPLCETEIPIEAAVLGPSRATPIADPGNIWERLSAAGFAIPSEITFTDFMTADNGLSVAEIITNDEIVNSIRRQVVGVEDSGEEQNEEEEADDGDTVEPLPAPNASDALNALSRQTVDRGSRRRREQLCPRCRT